MSRHLIYCDDDYEITVGYQFSTETLYVQVLADPHDPTLAEQTLEDFDIECGPVTNVHIEVPFGQMISHLRDCYKDYLSVLEYENLMNCDMTDLYSHIVRERTDRDLCNQIYRWKMVGKQRQQKLEMVEKKSVL